MKVFFDMDGVLVDLYGVLGEAWGVDPHSLKDHAGDTPQKYKEWVRDQGGPYRAFRDIRPLHWGPMQDFMKELHARGHVLEILSSVGADEDFMHGIMRAKVEWLANHYGGFFDRGILQGTVLVPGGHIKAKHATADSLLIDDSPDVLQHFRDAGGQTYLWDERVHELSIAEILDNIPDPS